MAEDKHICKSCGTPLEVGDWYCHNCYTSTTPISLKNEYYKWANLPPMLEQRIKELIRKELDKWAVEKGLTRLFK